MYQFGTPSCHLILCYNYESLHRHRIYCTLSVKSSCVLRVSGVDSSYVLWPVDISFIRCFIHNTMTATVYGVDKDSIIYLKYWFGFVEDLAPLECLGLMIVL